MPSAHKLFLGRISPLPTRGKCLISQAVAIRVKVHSVAYKELVSFLPTLGLSLGVVNLSQVFNLAYIIRWMSNFLFIKFKNLHPKINE